MSVAKTPSPQALLTRYFVHLRMNNWSPRTIDRRSFSLGTFIQWCGDRGIDSVSEITTEAVESYRRSLFHHRHRRTGKPIKFCTQASYLSAIRHWLAWLCEQGWIETNPAKEIELPKEEQRLPASYLTISEVESLLNSVDLTTPAGLRDRAILETFYSTGMRRAELIALQLDDLNRDGQLITIRQGKGIGCGTTLKVACGGFRMTSPGVRCPQVAHPIPAPPDFKSPFPKTTTIR